MSRLTPLLRRLVGAGCALTVTAVVAAGSAPANAAAAPSRTVAHAAWAGASPSVTPSNCQVIAPLPGKDFGLAFCFGLEGPSIWIVSAVPGCALFPAGRPYSCPPSVVRAFLLGQL